MERKPYSAGAVKFSFWFMEFRKTVQLLSEGKSFADIKKLNEEINIYGAPTLDTVSPLNGDNAALVKVDINNAPDEAPQRALLPAPQGAESEIL